MPAGRKRLYDFKLEKGQRVIAQGNAVLFPYQVAKLHNDRSERKVKVVKENETIYFEGQ